MAEVWVALTTVVGVGGRREAAGEPLPLLLPAGAAVDPFLVSCPTEKVLLIESILPSFSVA
jgi:hypothetical protein